jgi:hypothetical protein
MTKKLENNKKLIRTLIEQTQKLPYGNKEALEKQIKRARMILMNIPAVKEFASSLLNIDTNLGVSL